MTFLQWIWTCMYQIRIIFLNACASYTLIQESQTLSSSVSKFLMFHIIAETQSCQILKMSANQSVPWGAPFVTLTLISEITNEVKHYFLCLLAMQTLFVMCFLNNFSSVCQVFLPFIKVNCQLNMKSNTIKISEEKCGSVCL